MTAVAMKLGQLRRMGLAELSERSRQQVLKWLDRVSAIGQSGAHAFDARTVARFQAESPDRFFSGADALCDLTSDIGVGDACTRIVAVADRLCDGRFDLLGIGTFRSETRSTGTSIRCRAGARRSCIGAASTRSMPRSSATARSSGSSTVISGWCIWVRRTA